MTRFRRKIYPKHSGDAFDRFLSESSRGEDGQFDFKLFIAFMRSLDCPADFVPKDGNNGTKRMTAGINLRSWFSDGVLRFKDGSTVALDLEDSQ